MKVLVTGANGFAGRHLYDGLIRMGHEVIPCVRKVAGSGFEEPLCLPDSGEDHAILLEGIDAVVHAAGVAHQPTKNPAELRLEFEKGNRELTVALAEAVSNSDTKCLIHLSSIAAAGYTCYSAGQGLSEKDEVEPQNDYGLSKRKAEPAVEKLEVAGKLGVNLRPPLIYGSGARGNWPKLLRLARSPMPLPFAWVNNRRSFLGVQNLSSLVGSILEKVDRPDLSGTYHVSDADVVSLRDVVSALREAEGRKPGLVGFPDKAFEFILKAIGKGAISDGLFADLVLDCSKVRESFSWTPPEATLEGMKRSLK